MRCFARFFARTGWNVPAPMCSVTQANSTPRLASAASSGSSKCRPPARVDLRERFVLRKRALDQHLDVSAGLLTPEQARLDHLGVVEYQQVAGREQLRQIGEAATRDGRRADAEQAASRSLRVRILRDQLGRQL